MASKVHLGLRWSRNDNFPMPVKPSIHREGSRAKQDQGCCNERSKRRADPERLGLRIL